PAIFVGGGYDTNQDYASSFPPTADTRGRAMYVIDAVTATLVKAFQNGGSKMVSGGAISGMDYSIPSDVAALNTDLDGEGLIDRAYVGDSGGQVWRFDVNSPDPGEWTARIIATLSGTALVSPFPDDTATFTRTPGLKRKFMYPPVVVKQQIEFTDSGGTAVKDRYDGVYIGTGDRENPNFGTSDDAMFMIKDYDIGLTASNTAPSTIGNMMNIYDLGISCSGSPETCSQTITNTDKELLKTKQGWYYPLKNGEKVTASPTVFQNVLRFATFSPNESLDSCLPAGRGALYVMGAQFGELVNALTSSATLPIARQYTGFSVRGFIPTGTVLIRDKNIYVVHIAEGRLLYQKIGTVGGATKIYWYREQAR
ncbi:MAG TPA: hypothetical protein PKD29_11415, partial [Rhodocyclaceae bacterium]|nr:hypothetical protein [Rhodocyclaceae bacterium]